MFWIIIISRRRIKEINRTVKRILQSQPLQKVVIASGYSDNRRVIEAQRLGAGTYLKKPYTLEKIGMAVKTELGKAVFQKCA